MSELNSDDIEGMLDFFILQTLSHQPLSGFAIERHIERVHKLLEIAAERKGKPRPGSLHSALGRLERAGFVETHGRHADSSSEQAYSLTLIGREQLHTQRAGWASTLVRFIDEGGLDYSFRRFLTRDL